MKTTDYVTYSQFGASADGVTNDFYKIKAAHDYANANGLPVKADGEKYLIRETVGEDGKAERIVIKTSVDFGNATFIIDDSALSYYSEDGMARSHVFSVESDNEPITITDRNILSELDGIGEGTKKLNYAPGYPAMLVIYNEEHNVFRRYGGYSAKNGCAQKELISVSPSGEVDASTPFMFNYPKVTRMDVYRTDDKPITLSGGTFITVSGRENIFPFDEATGERKCIGGYFSRGMRISRSHTTLKGVKHLIEGEYTVREEAELKVGGPFYSGFFCPCYADEVTLTDCVLTGRRCYTRPQGGATGTYDFNAAMVNKIRLIGCTQSNFKVDQTTGVAPTEDSRPEDIVYSMSRSNVSGHMICWGIGGTNFCKNMEYVCCTLSRFDAHQGLYNGLIKDSTINFMELTGKGEMRIEGVDWYSPGPGETYNSFVYLRSDYGSTWDGTVTIKDSTAHVSHGDTYIFAHSYANWDFGYICHFPSLEIDGLRYEGLDEGADIYLVTESRSVKKEPALHLPKTKNIPYTDENGERSFVNMNPIAPPKRVRVRNLHDGRRLKVSLDEDFYAGTEFIYK